jgi:hypothetical protein
MNIKEASMESVEEFMRRYISEHIAEEKYQQASHALFLQKFFAADCDYGRRLGMLEMFHSEKVKSISGSDIRAEVITTREIPDRPGDFYDLRYLLQAHGDNWLICEVDVRCCSCNGEPGKDSCPSCHGTGWRNTNMSKVRTTAFNRKSDAQKVTT